MSDHSFNRSPSSTERDPAWTDAGIDQCPVPSAPGQPLPEVSRSRNVYSGRIINVRVDDIILPTGQEAVREIVEHPGAVVILAIDQDDQLYLVRQYRHPIKSYILELPAGVVEPGEQPLPAAQRELREEVGIEARRWTCLGSFYSTPGFCTERLYAYLAQELSSATADPDYDEDICVVRCSVREVFQRVRQVSDAKTLATLCLYTALQKSKRAEHRR